MDVLGSNKESKWKICIRIMVHNLILSDCVLCMSFFN
jgi:hypothetical protein